MPGGLENCDHAQWPLRKLSLDDQIHIFLIAKNKVVGTIIILGYFKIYHRINSHVVCELNNYLCD